MTTDSSIYELVFEPSKTKWKILQGFGSSNQFSHQANIGDRIIADTESNSSFKINVPVSPTPGDFFVVRMMDDGNYLIIDFNNSKFQGENYENIYLQVKLIDIEFTFVSPTIGWISVPEGLVRLTN